MTRFVKRFFPEGARTTLTLTDVKATSTGVVVLSYDRARNAGEAPAAGTSSEQLT